MMVFGLISVPKTTKAAEEWNVSIVEGKNAKVAKVDENGELLHE